MLSRPGVILASAEAQGYSPLSIRNFLLVTAHLSRWIEENGLGLDALTHEHLEAFFATRRREGRTAFLTCKSWAAVQRYLQRTGILSLPEAPPPSPSTPIDKLLEPYTRYLLQERGLTPSVITYYGRIARRFIESCFGTPAETSIEMGNLRAADVTKFILQQARSYSTGTSKLNASALKSWLRFLHLTGELTHDLTGAVPAIAGWRLTGLPKATPPEQIRQLLRSCDRRTHLGRRDFAVILLMVRLGLRPSEVAALQLDDIDWRCGQLVVMGKGSHVEPLPLPSDVGEALARYLHASRPAMDTRALFLRVRPPRDPLTRGAVLAIVRYRFLKLGLLPVRGHRLRHTAATEMLRKGGSLDEIAHVLRHRSYDTTAIYAKVDHAALRALARPWPGGAR